MDCRALIPVKPLYIAKSRLHQHLNADQRTSLVLKMLGHVLITLQMAKQVQKIYVVTIDPDVISEAKRLGAIIILEELHGHNQALSTAAKQIKKENDTGLITISADIPLLTPQDIAGLLINAERNDIVLAPSKEGTGTNALFTHSPLLIPYLFGSNSFLKYLNIAQERNLHTNVYRSKTLEFDIDTIEDLQELKKIKPYY